MEIELSSHSSPFRQLLSCLAAAYPDRDTVRNDIETVASFDRFQASWGINQAADFIVGAAAEAAPTARIELRRYSLGGATRWWTFDAPCPWTPLSATATVQSPDGPVLLAEYPAMPYTLATYSAATDGCGLGAQLSIADQSTAGSSWRNRIAVVRHNDVAQLLDGLREAGAAGVLVGPGVAGAARRVELDAASTLVGFSLADVAWQTAVRAASNGWPLLTHVNLGPAEPMPVASALLPGTEDGEVWILAHLCHPRPGANDNASGVIAALGGLRAIAAARADTGRTARLGIRFLWMPELVGTAAFLHDRLRGERCPSPVAAIDLDMVGTDQARWGIPMAVEAGPFERHTWFATLARTALSWIAESARRHGRNWHWESIDFRGFSDHALLLDPCVDTSAVLLTHRAELVNHSGADTVDLMDVDEVRRAGIVAAALAEYVATAAAKPWERNASWSQPESANPTALLRRWDGPFNLRGMACDLPSAERTWLRSALHDKRVRTVASLIAFGIDGRRDANQVLEYTRRHHPNAPTREVVDRLLDLFVQAGWAEVRQVRERG
jgi:hypothetical protein